MSLVALKVTEDNLSYILDHAKRNACNLDFLEDNVQSNAEYGFETYIITDGSLATRNVTYTEFADADFRVLWQFKAPEQFNTFAEIERV